ncbi:MAG: hypothetical protein ABFD24_08515 [Anaerolineaceae bacterium]
MANLLRFLIQFEFLFYGVLAVVIFIYLRKLIATYRQWRLAYFGLEKETAQGEFNQNLTVVIISLLMAAGLFVLTVIVAPSVPGVQALSTPTVNTTAQPASGTDTPSAATTTSATTTGFIATLEAAYGQGCVPDQVNWTEPRSGDTISGTVTLKGTVEVTSLGYYKYEFSAVGNESWTTIAAGNQPVQNDALGGSWDTSNMTPGDYLLRLVVTDSKNQEYPPCTIQIKITAPAK